MPSPRQALEATRPARQTPPEARPNRKRGGRGVRFAATVWLAPLSAALADRSSGRPLEPGGDLRPRGMITLPDLAQRRRTVAFEAGGQNPAYRSPRKILILRILIVECESEAFAGGKWQKLRFCTPQISHGRLGDEQRWGQGR